MSARAYRKGDTLCCPYCDRKVGAVQPDGSILHHDYRTRVTLVAGLLRLACQHCRGEIEIRVETV